MSVPKEKIEKMLDQLNSEDQQMIYDLVKRLAERQVIVQADHSPLEKQELKDIQQAEKEEKNGELIDLEDIKREYKI